MQLRPICNYIIGKRFAIETTEFGSIIERPDNRYVKNKKVRVLAIHTCRDMEKGFEIPQELQPGDLIMTLQYDGKSIFKYENQSLELIHMELVPVVVRERYQITLKSKNRKFFNYGEIFKQVRNEEKAS